MTEIEKIYALLDAINIDATSKVNTHAKLSIGLSFGDDGEQRKITVLVSGINDIGGVQDAKGEGETLDAALTDCVTNTIEAIDLQGSMLSERHIQICELMKRADEKLAKVKGILGIEI